MKDLTIMVHDDYLDRVVDSMHEAALVEVSDVERDRELGESLEMSEIPDIVGRCTDYDMKLSSIIDVFDRVETDEGNTIQEFLNPEETEAVKREKRDLDTLFDEIDKAVEERGENVLSLDEKLTHTEERIKELRSVAEHLELIQDLNLDLDHLGESEFTVMRIGKTSHPRKVKKAFSDLENSFHFINKVGEEEYVVTAGAHIRKKTEFEGALREGDVRVFDLENVPGTPKKSLKRIKLKIKRLQDRKDEVEEEIRKIKNKTEKKFRILKEELDIYRDKKEVVQNFGKTESTSVIKAWAPEDNVDKVEKIVKKNSDDCAVIMTEEPADPDDVPIQLQNPSFLRPFEMLTNMFAPPKYDEADPTFILAPAFILFFGLMLGDLVYGVLILITSILLLRGLGRIEQGTRRFSWILFSIGISTIFFGFLQGSYLGPQKGEFANMLGFFGIPFPTFLNTLSGDGPLQLLIVSLLIGLAYLNIGFVMGFIQYLKRGDYKSILLENVSWWILQPGGFILLSGLLFRWYDFSTMIYAVASIMAVIGLGLLLISARGLFFFELTGFIGDFLSFARILALGLATGGIALTVNVLAGLVVKSSMNLILSAVVTLAGLGLAYRGRDNQNMVYAGVFIIILGALGLLGNFVTQLSFLKTVPFYILSLLIVIGGHLANAVLQALGSFVHSLRLQYVEFFGTFYEGGGSPFTPFKPEREHTELEEDVME